MKKYIFGLMLLFVFLSSKESFAQGKNIWRTIGMIKFDMKMGEANDLAVQKPRAEPMIKAMNGKEYVVKGYIIPLSGKKGQSHFMFSAYPFDSCFFCGKAGPETVMEVFTKDEKKIEYSDDPIYIKGTFEYLGYKPNDIMFSLKDAYQVENPNE